MFDCLTLSLKYSTKISILLQWGYDLGQSKGKQPIDI
jgi:hypothetical protein